MKFLHILAVFILSLAVALTARAAESIQDVPIAISALSAEQLSDTVNNMGPEDHVRIIVEPGAAGENTIIFPVNVGSSAAVFDLHDLQRVEVLRGPQGTLDNVDIVFDGSQAGRRLVSLSDQSRFGLRGVSIRGFGSSGDGGVGQVRDDAVFEAYRAQFADNHSGAFGGVLAATGNGQILVSESFFHRNVAELYGGSVALLGNATGHLQRSGFFDGDAGSYGCDVHVETGGTYMYSAALVAEGSQFSGPCLRASYEAPFGKTFSYASGVYVVGDGINSTGMLTSYNSFYAGYTGQYRLQANKGSKNKPQSICEDFGSGAFESLGFNLSEDDSCGLDQPSDLTNTDGMAAADEDGIIVPQAGSPLIDSGATGTLVFPGETLRSLPCGYKDIMGIGRPQDANDDGVFECDRGAVEVAGPGQLMPGHSAAFFNALRDGEGQYVEMLNANTAVVYTFTHRPDGGGSAWFIGVGYVAGNSIVIDQVLRPTGTSFGDQFDSAEIEIAAVGGQSMVFNDCKAASPGGNVAYSGNTDLGYEALITRALRLSNILGCGTETPHPNAGLSGSYFLPARDGEGIVVQWLPNGQVLVIFFTYDLNGDQQWVLGIGKAEGFSVTMDALYASSNTVWGSGFDPDDITLSPWGTFELTWTECNGVQFSYNSTVAGYGSATRQYIRLSTLWDTSCPAF